MIPHGVEVFVGLEPIDLRWGFDRLAGLVTERRRYCVNRGPAAAVVSDTPTEAALHPAEWGVWVLE